MKLSSLAVAQISCNCLFNNGLRKHMFTRLLGILASGFWNPGSNLLHVVRSSLTISLYVLADIPRFSSASRNSINRLFGTYDKHESLRFFKFINLTNLRKIAEHEEMYFLLRVFECGIFIQSVTKSFNFASGTAAPVFCSYNFSRIYCECLADFANFTILSSFSSVRTRVRSNIRSPDSFNDAGGFLLIATPRLMQCF